LSFIPEYDARSDKGRPALGDSGTQRIECLCKAVAGRHPVRLHMNESKESGKKITPISKFASSWNVGLPRSSKRARS